MKLALCGRGPPRKWVYPGVGKDQKRWFKAKHMSNEDNKSNNHHMRVSSQEIDKAIEQLEIAFGDGRLDENDFDQRMGKALVAKTKGELSALLFDLPVFSPTVVPVKPPPSLPKLGHKAVAVFSGIEQKGNFIFPSHYYVKAIMGGCLLDLSHAQFESATTHIYITAILGGVQIFVPKGVRVTVYSSPILGGISQNILAENLPNNAPQIHIFSKAILGGIEIVTK